MHLLTAAILLIQLLHTPQLKQDWLANEKTQVLPMVATNLQKTILNPYWLGYSGKACCNLEAL